MSGTDAEAAEGEALSIDQAVGMVGEADPGPEVEEIGEEAAEEVDPSPAVTPPPSKPCAKTRARAKSCRPPTSTRRAKS